MEKGFVLFAWISGAVLLSATACLAGYLFVHGWSALSTELVFGTVRPMDALFLKRPVFDGIFPAMAGTVMLVLLSVSIAIPLGTFTGIYMAEYAPETVKRKFGLFYDILAGAPSIVVGLYGFSIAIFLHRHVSERLYPCLLISALSLSFLVLPYLIRSTQTALENLPADTRLTALALGASKIQNLFYVLIPRSLPGILSGIVLSIGRCAEDTAVIMLTGAAASAGLPKSVLGSYEALPFYIYTISAQYMDPEELSRGYGAAIILFTVCAGLFFLSFILRAMLGQAMGRGR
jgi:phosphate transport system permease protein